MKKVLALDFDGVIWDSAGECFQIAWRAYQELTGKDLSGSSFEKSFLRGRPLARTGHDFYLLLKLMEPDPEIDWSEVCLATFAQERVAHSEVAAQFDRVFYRLRAHFRDSDSKSWVSWQKPYYDVLAALDSFEEQFHGLALATTKDTQSASSLLALTGRDWPVFGKEFSEHKADQIFGISQHFKVKPEQVLFIDDLVENLLQVQPTKAKMALASWGYNRPESRKQALELGIRVLSLAELGQFFQDFLDDKS